MSMALRKYQNAVTNECLTSGLNHILFFLGFSGSDCEVKGFRDFLSWQSERRRKHITFEDAVHGYVAIQAVWCCSASSGIVVELGHILYALGVARHMLRELTTTREVRYPNLAYIAI
jgi:hypothetical protein